MTWEEIMSQKETKIITKRYKITQTQNDALEKIDQELNIPPSSIVRLALDCFLPKLSNEGFKYEGIKKLWNERKF